MTNLQFRRYEYHRRRYGAAANFDAKPAENTSLYLRLLWSGYLEVRSQALSGPQRTRLGQRVHAAAELHPGSQQSQRVYSAAGVALEQDTTDSLERIENDLGVVGGSSVFSTFKLDYRASFALGTDRVSAQLRQSMERPQSGLDRLRQQHRSALSDSSAPPASTRPIRPTTR